MGWRIGSDLLIHANKLLLQAPRVCAGMSAWTRKGVPVTFVRGNLSAFASNQPARRQRRGGR